MASMIGFAHETGTRVWVISLILSTDRFRFVLLNHGGSSYAYTDSASWALERYVADASACIVVLLSPLHRMLTGT